MVGSSEQQLLQPVNGRFRLQEKRDWNSASVVCLNRVPRPRTVFHEEKSDG